MRFLIDNALPPRLAGLLLAAGHDAVHVSTCAMHSASDRAILEKALEEDRVIVSADSDFAPILAAQQAERPSFILFREPDFLLAQDYANRMLLAMPALEPELAAGCVAVFRQAACASESSHSRNRPPPEGLRTANRFSLWLSTGSSRNHSPANPDNAAGMPTICWWICGAARPILLSPRLRLFEVPLAGGQGGASVSFETAVPLSTGCSQRTHRG